MRLIIFAQALQCFFIALGIKAVAQRRTCEAAPSCSHTARLPVEGSALAVSSAWQPLPTPDMGMAPCLAMGLHPKATSSARTCLASFSNSLTLTGYLPFLLNSCSLALITYLSYCVSFAFLVSPPLKCRLQEGRYFVHFVHSSIPVPRTQSRVTQVLGRRVLNA